MPAAHARPAEGGRADYLGSTDARYRLSASFAEDPDALTLRCVRRKSITRSAANA
ncbi:MULTISPECIES: hypothetical protein [unclassified Streptomyces]|uniref:hypothetical protein n=1 Tax=unclassified Streptomyces TaxID=2593676 RepID=UPI000A6C8F10|nr:MULTISPECIES: hypothetical protein [unclassified Streptomyces]